MALFGDVSKAPLQQGAKKSKKFLKKGMKKAKAALSRGETKGTESIASGLKAANPIYQDAASKFDPYMQSGQSLNNLYTGALGGSGQAGFDAAREAFHTAPGYEFLQQQGEQSALRNNAALGGVASGNTLTDLAKFNTGLADQSYQQWMDNLFRGSGQGLTAATGQAGVLQNLGQATNQAGRDTAGIYTDTAGRLANAFTQGNENLASNASQLGSNLYQANAQNQANQTALVGSILGGATSLLGAGTGGLGGNLMKLGGLFG
jgi:hypothetical protein